jgi:SnoaL-like domain
MQGGVSAVQQDERIETLERRLRAAEDHLAILNLLASYGPLVDSCNAEAAAGLWVEGGGYNYSGGNSNGTRLEAPADLIKVYEGAGHLSLVAAGCSHLTATPAVTVHGDHATALGYSYVVLKEGDRWFLFRAAINEWKLVRTPAGWRIAERFNRTLTGTEESHEVMRRSAA